MAATQELNQPSPVQTRAKPELTETHLRWVHIVQILTKATHRIPCDASLMGFEGKFTSTVQNSFCIFLIKKRQIGICKGQNVLTIQNVGPVPPIMTIIANSKAARVP